MSSLEELIRNGGIEFYSYGRKIDADIDDFGEYNRDLVQHIIGNAGKCISIAGKGLEQYLKDESNLFCLADFVSFLWFEGAKKRRFTGACIHVDVDITKFDEHYIQPKEEPLINGLGQKVCDAADWVPEMRYFEKTWHFALCDAIGGMVGYPGYEHPRSDSEFRHHISGHISDYMIGTKAQLHRYKRYARESLKKVIDDTDDLKYDPESIFYETLKLREIEMNARYAIEVAENIQHFQIEYENKEKKE